MHGGMRAVTAVICAAACWPGARSRKRPKNSTGANRSPCWSAAAGGATTPTPASSPGTCRGTFRAIPPSSPRTCRRRPAWPPPARSTPPPTRTALPSRPSPMAPPWSRCSAIRARATTRKSSTGWAASANCRTSAPLGINRRSRRSEGPRARGHRRRRRRHLNTAIVPKALNALIGTKFKVIAGYDTGGPHPVDRTRRGRGHLRPVVVDHQGVAPALIRDKLLNIIVQMGLQKLSDLPDVPSALDLVTDPENRPVLELILIRQEAGRPSPRRPASPRTASPRCGAPSPPRSTMANSARMRIRRNWRSNR